MLVRFLLIKDIAKEAEEVIFTECVYCVMKQVAVLSVHLCMCVCAHIHLYVCVCMFMCASL